MFTTITVETTSGGELEVDVDLFDGKDAVDTPTLVAKIKRLYLDNSKKFEKQERKHEALTGEGTESAADWCSDENRSETLALEQLVHQARASLLARKKQPAVSKEHAAAAAATREESTPSGRGRRGRGRGGAGRGRGKAGAGGGRGGRGGQRRDRGGDASASAGDGRAGRSGRGGGDAGGAGGAGGGRGSGQGSGTKRRRGLSHHEAGRGELDADEEEEFFPSVDTSDDETPEDVGMEDRRQTAIAGGRMGRQTRPRKKAVRSWARDDADGPESILAKVANHLMTRGGGDGGGGGGGGGATNSAEVAELRHRVDDLAHSQAETNAGVSSILGILQGQQAAQQQPVQQQPPLGGVNLAQPGFIPGIGVTPVVQSHVAAGYGGGLAGMPGFAAPAAPVRQPRAAAVRMPPAGVGAGIAGPAPGAGVRSSRRAGTGEGRGGGAGSRPPPSTAQGSGRRAAARGGAEGAMGAASGGAGGAMGAASGGAGAGPKCKCGRDAKLFTVRKKESPNLGKSFYACPVVNVLQKCNLHQWALPTSIPTASRRPWIPVGGSSGGGATSL